MQQHHFQIPHAATPAVGKKLKKLFKEHENDGVSKYSNLADRQMTGSNRP